MAGMTGVETLENAKNRFPFWAGATLLSAIALIAQLPLYDRGLVAMDEGHLLAAADALASGKRLYADIHTGIFPGIYLAARALLAAFGADAVVLRWAAVVMNVFICLALWSVARRMVAAHWSWLPPLLYLALISVGFPVLSMFNYSTLSVCFGLGALSFMLRYLESGRSGDGVLMGAAIAAAALTKQNFGGLVFLALLSGLLAGRRDSALAPLGIWRGVWPVAAGGIALTLCGGAYLAWEGTLLAFADSTLLSLAGSQLKDFNNPIPPIFGAHPEGDGRFVFLYTPPTLFHALIHGTPFAGMEITPGLRSLAIRASYGLPLAALMAAPLLAFFTRHWSTGPARTAAQSSILFAVIFAPGIFPSAIWSHLAFVMIPILLLFAFLGDRAEEALRRFLGHGAATAGRVLAAALTAAAMLVAVRTAVSVMAFNSEPLGLERATLQVSSRDRGLLRGAVGFIENCSHPGEPILVLPDIPVLYFLADRPNPSPFDLAIPGNVDGERIAREAEAAGVRCAVFNPRMYPEFPPFDELFPGLAQHLETQFRVDRKIRGGQALWLGLVRRAP